MISEQDKQAIFNGAYGVTRSGTKVKYLFTSDVNPIQTRHLFIAYVENDDKVDFHNTLWLTEDFTFYVNERNMHSLDVIGLWQDKSEPFDLERALAGELVKYSDKPCYVYQSKVTGLFWVEDQDGSFVDNDISLEAVSEQGMWKELEPVSNTVTLTLPCPLKEPKDGMWFIQDSRIIKSSYTKKNPSHSQVMLDDGFYFATKEDAQMWLDAMKNNRK